MSERARLNEERPIRAGKEQAAARRLIAQSANEYSGAGPLHKFIQYHSKRWDYVLRLCKTLVPREASVLDVGRSHLSFALAAYFENTYTLGFPIGDREPYSEGEVGRRPTAHITFNLNNVQDLSMWPELPKVDLICFAETIEHLYTAPELVLLFLKTALKPGGYIVCQTPNAASLAKRLRLLAGRNPYDRIRPYTEDPGHFREYTKAELFEIGQAAELKVLRHEYVDYFGTEGSQGRQAIAQLITFVGVFYSPFRRGQTVLYTPT